MKSLSTSVTKINQFVNKEIFIGQLSIEQLANIVKYTNRISNPGDPFDEKSKEYSMDTLYYQRIKNSDRSYAIKLFFLKNIWNKVNYQTKRISPLGTFPSSIIIAYSTYDSKDELEFNDYVKSDPKPEYVYLNQTDNILKIPETKQGLIVDGQHRIAGLELLLEEARSNDIKIRKANQRDYFTDFKSLPYKTIEEEILKFNFIISFLLDFDLYEQAEIFATVNFNQQKVNKSFYYDIFGSSNSGKTIEKLLHDITSHMNYKEDSPLLKKIKMLGNGEGYFSQAFFVDALIPHFKNGVFQFIYTDYIEGGVIYKLFPEFLKQYFRSIFKIFQEYMPEPGKKYNNNLLKTTGMGAIIRLIPNIFNSIKSTKKIADPKEVLKLSPRILNIEISNFLEEIKESGDDLFGETGEFSKGAGKGLQNKLYEKIIRDLGITNKKNNEDEGVVI